MASEVQQNVSGVLSAKSSRVGGEGAPSPLSLRVVGWSLSLFLVVSYLLCVAYGLLVPSYPMHPAWSALLPGFSWISWSSFFLGLAEVFAYGWYAAVVFVPLYNWFSAHLNRNPAS